MRSVLLDGADRNDHRVVRLEEIRNLGTGHFTQQDRRAFAHVRQVARKLVWLKARLWR
jgi:hypothetical protein